MFETLYDRQHAAKNNCNISIAVNDPLCRSMEEYWAAGMKNQSRKRAIEHGENNHIISLVDETWILLLKDLGTFFTRITLAQLLALIRLTNGGLERIDIVDLLVSLT